MRSPSFNRIVSNESSCCSDPVEMEIVDQDALSVEQQLFRRERAACYQDCIETLPENYREVVVLSELEKLAADEIADMLGLSVEAVKMRMHRGRLQLLQVLKSHCKAEDWL
jgi:RNA polymerase sigma-70 factor (ECF subfamily)